MGLRQMNRLDEPSKDVALLMHEIAERLQALGNYVCAIRCSDAAASGEPNRKELFEKTSEELARTYEAYHRLRRFLGNDATPSHLKQPYRLSALTADRMQADSDRKLLPFGRISAPK